jgi:hypothetical protein
MNFFFRPTEFATPLSQLDSARRFKILSICLKNGSANETLQVQLLRSGEKMIPLREAGRAVFLNHSQRPAVLEIRAISERGRARRSATVRRFGDAFQVSSELQLIAI